MSIYAAVSPCRLAPCRHTSLLATSINPRKSVRTVVTADSSFLESQPQFWPTTRQTPSPTLSLKSCNSREMAPLSHPQQSAPRRSKIRQSSSLEPCSTSTPSIVSRGAAYHHWSFSAPPSHPLRSHLNQHLHPPNPLSGVCILTLFSLSVTRSTCASPPHLPAFESRLFDTNTRCSEPTRQPFSHGEFSQSR